MEKETIRDIIDEFSEKQEITLYKLRKIQNKVDNRYSKESTILEDKKMDHYNELSSAYEQIIEHFEQILSLIEKLESVGEGSLYD